MCHWGGRLHPVPQGFQLPKMNLHIFLILWFIGSAHPFVPPIKSLKGYDFHNKKIMNSVLSMMRRFVKDGILRGARTVGFDYSSGIKNVDDATILFKSVCHLFKYPSAVDVNLTDRERERRYSGL